MMFPGLQDALALVLAAAISGATPDPELQVDRWAEQHVKLPKSAAHPGDYRFARTPYARRVHQVLSPGHPCKRVVAKVASQMFKTQTALNWIGSVIHQAPGNILALQPTDGLAKRFSARVASMVRMVPALQECMAPARSRDKRNTVQAKDFKGDATLYINTSGAAANLAELTIRYLFLDEVDRMAANVDGEGDPVELAEARATQFQNICKFYEVSSPTIDGFSKIDELFKMGTQETYHVPCPHCGHLHELEQDNFRYSRDEEGGRVTRAWFVCPDCGCDIDEHHKTEMFKDEAEGGTAQWVAKSQGDGETVSFTMSAFYMPVGAVSWLDLARQHARAKDRLVKGDHTAMQVYFNTRLGLSYRDTVGATSAKQLMMRAASYAPRVLPDPALVITMSGDTQPNRLELQLEGWGPGMEHWVLDHIVLNGSPSDPPETPGSVWQRLDEIRRTPLLHVSGRPIYISAWGLDSGGANTQDVYNFGAIRKGQAFVTYHGANRPNRPIISGKPSSVDIDWKGNKIEGGAELWSVGTDTAKDYLFNNIQRIEGDRAFHFHDQLPDEWFEQLVVEQPRYRFVKGRTIREYIKPNGARNEALDLSVYNLALAYWLGLHKWSALDWRRLREKLIPPAYTPDLFSMPAAPILLPDSPSVPVVQTSAQTEPPRPVAAAATTSPAVAQPAISYPVHPAPAPMRRMRSRGVI